MKEIKNVRFYTNNQTDIKVKAWENVQLFVLTLTIIGQSIWLIANTIALARDFALKRPIADKIKNATLWAITCGLVASYFIL